MRPALVTFLAVALATTHAAPAAADARSETAARAAIKAAAGDYASMNYGTGASRLNKALKACGTTKCSAATRATLLADLGALQFKKGSKDEAAKAWRDAAKLQPGVALVAPFDGSDVTAAFTAAVPAAPAGGAAQASASGDFSHAPAAEQAVNTPLPIYVEGGGDSVTRVVVKYKPEGASAWKALDLKQADGSWSGLIPCADVLSGSLRYYIQGLDDSKTPVASSGDAKHPFTVKIKETISGPAPQLPGKPPPRSCAEATSDCPPDFPGCKKDKGGAATEESSETATDESGSKDEAPKADKAAFKRVWIGVSGEFELISLPSGTDQCFLVPQLNSTGGTNPNAALPANSNNMYCTTASGADFPSRANQDQNVALCTAAQVRAGLCRSDAAGTSGGGIVPGDMRLTASIDYAFTANLLAGVRLGATLLLYPGQAAVTDGRAFGSRFYGEGRGTWVVGENALGTPGIKPMFFVGGGVGAFDGHTSSTVALQPSGTPRPPLVTGTVNLWLTNGPGFALLGGGVRWALGDSFALTAAARLNASFGVNGLVPTYGPELGAQVGF